MKLFCPECGEAIPAAKINVFALVAVCSACNHLFPFNKPDDSDIYKRKKIFKPQQVQIYEHQDDVVMKYRWFQWKEVNFIAPFAFVWTTVILIFALTIRVSGDWTGLPFMTLHTGIDLGLLYQLSCLILNRTEISLTPDRIQVWHGPLFSPGGVSISISEIEQIYCKYLPVHPGQRNIIRLNPYKNRFYELHAVSTHSGDILIFGANEEEFVRFIGQRIRHYLRLEGELPFQDVTGKSFS